MSATKKYPHGRILKAVRAACLMFQKAESRWSELKASGATDDQIRAQIQKEFYLGGGVTIQPNGFVNHSSGGTNLWVSYFEFPVNENPEVKISGRQLIDLVREAFEIPLPGQPRLF